MLGRYYFIFHSPFIFQFDVSPIYFPNFPCILKPHLPLREMEHLEKNKNGNIWVWFCMGGKRAIVRTVLQHSLHCIRWSERKYKNHIHNWQKGFKFNGRNFILLIESITQEAFCVSIFLFMKIRGLYLVELLFLPNQFQLECQFCVLVLPVFKPKTTHLRSERERLVFYWFLFSNSGDEVKDILLL